MTSAIERLVSIGSGALGRGASPVVPELEPLFARADGFYAFESALHVRPSGAAPGALDWWNAAELWRAGYGDLVSGHLCFAEDVFGNQFTLREGRFFLWDAETGDAVWMADSVEGWAAALLGDSDYFTAYPLAHEWQRAHGPLGSGERLLPQQLFVLEGSFDVSNLRRCGDVEAMKIRAGYADALRQLPDGTTVRFETT